MPGAGSGHGVNFAVDIFMFDFAAFFESQVIFHG